MKRCATKLALFLLLGAILNVAVAWGCAFFIRFDWRQSRGYDHYTNWGDYLDGFSGYTASRWTRAGAQRAYVFFSESYDGIPGRKTIEFPEIIPTWAAAYIDVPELAGRTPSFPEEALISSSLVDARGWPCMSLWGGLKSPDPGWTVFGPNGAPLQLTEHRYWIIPIELTPKSGSVMDYRWLPLHPIWPGFVINTSFYAAILWPPFAALGAFRRSRRIKRGLCPKCGYDLRGSASQTCPECGNVLQEQT